MSSCSLIKQLRAKIPLLRDDISGAVFYSGSDAFIPPKPLGQNATPINRLVCIGYGFSDEQVNAIIDFALVPTSCTTFDSSVIFTPLQPNEIFLRPMQPNTGAVRMHSNVNG